MKKQILYILLSLVSLSSCEDYLDIEPEGKVIPKTVEDNRGVITSAYHTYPDHLSRVAFRADELDLDENYSDVTSYKDIYLWNDTGTDAFTLKYPYSDVYKSIFYCNYIINEGVKTMEDSEEKDQLIGEAYALRAYNHFSLVNMYAPTYNPESASSDRGIPLALEIDLEHVYTPASVQSVYDQIIEDISSAKNYLVDDTQDTGLNYRFSNSALYALEARAHLYMQNWDNVIDAVDNALAIKSDLVNLNEEDALLPNRFDAQESLLALDAPLASGVNEGGYVSQDLIGAFDQVNDLRFNRYFINTGSGYQSAKAGSDNFKCSFRVGELYLSKAEALLMEGRLNESKEVLLTLLGNRYESTYFSTFETEVEALSTAQYTDLLFSERRKELALEGQRWFDLRRTTQKQIVHTFDGEDYFLKENDPRYTIIFPIEARLNNPEL
ncbi:RagB/SusD family nutrient uptake outer membrane protein [Fulvivirga maritima]|uniref:RagB/SusD family nutrient uptake outer membrane protein n=1 Tax=Fulvivirga maritima TaxID=2904247 RepID=UPI001F20A5D8|nr:RagB/SusD family nutrient uptake outer membrane protein [Fulvivirga maritima]UII28192.1 RagB/SusD family nutrient uptake outer membrane protein [Fulvivirga maritima]